MKKSEVQKLLALIQAEYPQSFQKIDERQMALKIELWAKEFENDNSTLVWAAVRALLGSGREFAPNCGQIRDKMYDLMDVQTIDEQQAWALVSRACSNGYYGYKREFERLPPEVQRAVGRAEQLREWAQMDGETLQSVVASNFMRSYRARIGKEKALSRLPNEVKSIIGDLTDKMRLTEGNTNVLENSDDLQMAEI